MLNSVFCLLSQLYCLTFIAKEVFLLIALGVPDLPLLLRLISGLQYAVFALSKFVCFKWRLKDAADVYMKLMEIYPKTSLEHRLYRVIDFFWPKKILIVIYLYLGSIFFIGISPLLEGVVMYLVDCLRVGLGNAEFAYIKLYDIPYGFNHRRPFSYMVTYMMEVFHVQFVLIANVCPDIWLLCFTMQLCMHFNYLARIMEEYEPDESAPKKDQQFIAEFVKKHQIVLNIGQNVKDLFSVLLLIVFMSIATTLCCAGVYTLTQGLGRELLEYCAFLPCAIGNFFLICYYGQQLATYSEKVADAAYNHPWYNGSQSYKKTILIIMIRASRAVELNAYGLKPICLDAFKMLMGESYRVFAVLKQTMLD
ncbi:odorant receptor 49a-like [Stomoxys calcitrans]|nr:odorant receptor 49a-like [Stomoxys calcitrans]